MPSSRFTPREGSASDAIGAGEAAAARPTRPPPDLSGRASQSSQASRYDRLRAEAVDDGWPEDEADGAPHAPPTEVAVEQARRIITTNTSPDIGFDQSINMYRGCEHGCIYCYARPSHAWLGLSPGLDFETRLVAKANTAALLEQELAHPAYTAKPIALGTNTDPYQPIERQWRLTRSILELFDATSHPVIITTKSHTITRDIDLLTRLAGRDLVRVAISVTTLDPALARPLEPRASAPHRRLKAIAALAAAGVPVQVNVAPVIPGLTDSEIEAILTAARAAGARSASWIPVRLPLEVAELFKEWLLAHRPDRYRRVISAIRAMREGRDNTAAFGTRMRGTGQEAELLGKRFKLACRRLGFDAVRPGNPRSDLFVAPVPPGGQRRLAL